MTATRSDPRAASRWIADATKDWKRLSNRSAILVVADVIPAVGFAAGLGWLMGAVVPALEAPNIVSLATAVAPGAGLAVGSLLLRGLLAQCAVIASSGVANQVKSGLRKRLMPAVFSGRVSDSAAMAAVVEGVDSMEGHFTRFAPARTAAAVAPLALIAAAAFVSPFTAGILLFTLLPFIIGMALTGMAAASESRRQFQAMERLSGLFLDRIRALPAILVFQAEERQARLMAKASQELADRTSRVLRVAFLSSAILEFFSALAVALVAVYCGFNLLRILPFPAPDALTLGQAFFLLALAPEVYQPMRRLAGAYHERQAAEAAVPHLQMVEKALPPSRRTAMHLENPPAITYRNLSIAYGPGVPAVSAFDQHVEAGSIVALTGPSGSGKSSLLHVLLGLSPVSDGKILIDGNVLEQDRDLGPSIAYAGQAPMVIPGTLGDNIRLAFPEASERAVMEAAAKAGLSGNLDRPIDERGGGLSGGERRRLGLARAFLKPATILILDEPTAHLDSQSEARLLPVIKQAAAGRTTLIATHSTSVAAIADRVIALS
ncbi:MULTISPECIES: thiol reductant ABC exporter subunit CydD [unclassified Brevundimonas]|uniref:thiol reductant ABC exporter subunit CydD n=1 Tax=unclassified Brevundimonas TaxID=2622653 RepID=UPI0025C6AB01|nr:MULTISPECIES: thiol reductant ABC exporter subunit CydD [unclassified Brevundimonas]